MKSYEKKCRVRCECGASWTATLIGLVLLRCRIDVVPLWPECPVCALPCETLQTVEPI
jgi:hypothetical protein